MSFTNTSPNNNAFSLIRNMELKDIPNIYTSNTVYNFITQHFVRFILFNESIEHIFVSFSTNNCQKQTSFDKKN